MEYQALYRKWRPVRFDDVCGQENITSTLKNQIILNRVGHAYLFTGTRGTGKTSCAKIFAKTLNCQNPINGEPCGTCECCRLVEADSMYDILEIDAASKSRVEDIRGIIEEVVYAPSIGKMKVYIIDEVHMMTGNAFNALLKTLEEPPAYVVFILATTEVHKVPATILSRCQRFDFKRLSSQTIADRLLHVSHNEGIDLKEDAARYIGVLADGSLRDGLSILEQCQTAGTIDKDTVEKTVGIAPLSEVIDIINAARSGDYTAALRGVDTLYNSSKRMDTLLSELIECYRDILMIKAGGSDIVYRCDEDIAALADASRNIDSAYAIFCIETLAEAQAKTTKNSSNRIVAEVCVVKLCKPQYLGSGSAVFSRLERQETQQKVADVASDTAQYSEPDKRNNKAKTDMKNAAEADKNDEVSEDYTASKLLEGTAEPISEKPMNKLTGQKQKTTVKAADVIYLKIKQQLTVPGLLSFLPTGSDCYELAGNVLTIFADSQFFYEFINSHDNYAEIARCCKAALGSEISVKIVYNKGVLNNSLQEDMI